jgi:hypothetical protein
MNKVELKEQLYKYEIYLEEYYETFLNFKKEDFTYFDSLDIQKGKSYIVICDDPVKIKKFVAYYLIKWDFLVFETHNVEDHIDSYMKGTNINILTDVLLLYYNRHVKDYGGSENFIHSILLQTISGRSWKNRVTLLLSEKEITNIQNTSGLTTIRLTSNPTVTNNSSSNTTTPNNSDNTNRELTKAEEDAAMRKAMNE